MDAHTNMESVSHSTHRTYQNRLSIVSPLSIESPKASPVDKGCDTAYGDPIESGDIDSFLSHVDEEGDVWLIDSPILLSTTNFTCHSHSRT
jgi:hypothetical protein